MKFYGGIFSDTASRRGQRSCLKMKKRDIYIFSRSLPIPRRVFTYNNYRSAPGSEEELSNYYGNHGFVISFNF
jgi:hypothetical protein